MRAATSAAVLGAALAVGAGNAHAVLPVHDATANAKHGEGDDDGPGSFAILGKQLEILKQALTAVTATGEAIGEGTGRSHTTMRRLLEEHANTYLANEEREADGWHADKGPVEIREWVIENMLIAADADTDQDEVVEVLERREAHGVANAIDAWALGRTQRTRERIEEKMAKAIEDEEGRARNLREMLRTATMAVLARASADNARTRLEAARLETQSWVEFGEQIPLLNEEQARTIERRGR